jgi:hypothetical protein
MFFSNLLISICVYVGSTNSPERIWTRAARPQGEGQGGPESIPPSQSRNASTSRVGSAPAHSPPQNFRLRSRAIRANPEGPGTAEVLGKWPRSITVMTIKNRNADRIRDNDEGSMDVSLVSRIGPKNAARANPGVSRNEENYSIP